MLLYWSFCQNIFLQMNNSNDTELKHARYFIADLLTIDNCSKYGYFKGLVWPTIIFATHAGTYLFGSGGCSHRTTDFPKVLGRGKNVLWSAQIQIGKIKRKLIWDHSNFWILFLNWIAKTYLKPIIREVQIKQQQSFALKDLLCCVHP